MEEVKVEETTSMMEVSADPEESAQAEAATDLAPDGSTATGTNASSDKDNTMMETEEEEEEEVVEINATKGKQ